MEKEGLHRVMEFLRGENLTVGVLVTDRHRQINKWLREMHPNVKHYYDVWHVAKGIAPIGLACNSLLLQTKHLEFRHYLYMFTPSY